MGHMIPSSIDSTSEIIGLHISVLFLKSVNNGLPATTKHSLITLPSSKGFAIIGIFTYVVFMHSYEMLINITLLVNIYTGTAY
jgi:hypothetical protein